MSAIQILLSNPYKELSNLPKKHLLIDTNFLIDAVKYPSRFNELLKIFKDCGFTLVSVQATLIEFVKGSKSIENYSKKVKYYNSVINTVLPLMPQVHANVDNITRVLLKKSGQLSYVDCLLLGTTMTYKNSVYLLTRDRSDIPISIFNVIASIMVETQDNNCTFCIYEYKEKQYEDLLIKLIEEIPF